MDAVNASTLTLKLHTLVAPNTTTLILTIDEHAGRADAHVVRNSLVTTLYTILSSESNIIFSFGLFNQKHFVAQPILEKLCKLKKQNCGWC